MSAYYNEFDPYAAAWLRNLIAAGHIAEGDVDERSIADVRPADLAGYTQCHFFAGIGGWSLALRLTGWPDDRPVWTGSCPCQPFSSAGAQVGGDDPRHLWPAWFKLIEECGPPVVFGEQVAAAVQHGWLDLVFEQMEARGYACGAAVLGAHSVGAPHVRLRLWFVAQSSGTERGPWRTGRDGAGERGAHGELAGSGDARLLADADRAGSGEQRQQGLPGEPDAPRGHDVDGRGAAGVLGEPCDTRLPDREPAVVSRAGRRGQGGAVAEPGRAPWSDLEWLPCRDGKARATQPGLQPLVAGVPGRVGRLRAYGNAIVPQVAAEFIGAYLNAVTA